MTDKSKSGGTGRTYEYLPYPDVGFGPDNFYEPDPADPAGGVPELDKGRYA